MAERPLQAIQDVVRIPWYEEPNINRGYGSSYFGSFALNLIPEKIIDFNQSAIQQLSKRQGFADAGLTFLTSAGTVNNQATCYILDVITMTALYDVYVAAVYDTSNNTIYIIQFRPIAGTATRIGTIAGSSVNDHCYLSEYSQSNAGSLFPAVAVSWTNAALTASKGYYSRSSGGLFGAASLTEVTDVNFPPKQTPALISIGHFVYMNGTMYIASIDGRIFNSASTNNDITTWSDSFGPGVLSANAYPDQLVGLVRYKHHIVAFGKNTIQFFDDVGNEPSPIQPTQAAFVKFGAFNPRLIRNVDDVLYWVAYGESGQTGLWMMDGYTPTKVSTPYIDNKIYASASSIGNAYNFKLEACLINGKRQIFMNAVSGTTMVHAMTGISASSGDTYPVQVVGDCDAGSMVYSVEDKVWWGFNYNSNSGITPLFITAYPTPNVAGTSYTQYVLLNGTAASAPAQTVRVLKIAQGIYYDTYDDGNSQTWVATIPITCLVQTNPLWFNNQKRKRISKALIIMNENPTLPSGDTNIYNMYLVYTRDINEDVTANFITRSIPNPSSVFRYYIPNLGMGRVWTFCLVDRSKSNLRLKGLELEIQQGTH